MNNETAIKMKHKGWLINKVSNPIKQVLDQIE